MEIRIKLTTGREQVAKMDIEAIAKTESRHADSLYLEAIEDCIDKHRKEMTKQICQAVKTRGRLLQRYANNVTDYTYTVNGIEITATFRPGRNSYFHGKELDASGMPRFFSETIPNDVLDLFIALGL